MRLAFTVTLLGFWVALGFILYEPHVARPFDVVDFPEFFPRLRAAEGTFDGFQAVTAHYARHGRFNVLDYALLSAKWTLFGESPVAWQLTQAGIMFAMAGAMFLLLRRLGATPLAAFLATTLVLCAQTTTTAWYRLTIREGLGAVFLYLGLLGATYLHSAERWRRLVLVICTLTAAMLLLKEMLAAAVPALWFAAVLGADGAWWRTLRSRRALWFGAALVAVSALVLVPTAAVALTAPPDAFARSFGSRFGGLGELVLTWTAIVIPFAPVTIPFTPATIAADTFFLLLILLGWRVLARDERARPVISRLLVFALGLPALCALAYLPWPSFRLFHGLPYVLGAGVLVSMAITAIQRAHPRLVGLAAGAWLWITVYMALEADRQARWYDASVRTIRMAVSELGRYVPQDTVLYALCGGLPSENWQRIDRVMEGIARSEQVRLPHLVATSCDQLEQRASDPVVALLAFGDGGETLVRAERRIIHEARRFDWTQWRLVRDTLEAVLHVPSPAGGYP